MNRLAAWLRIALIDLRGGLGRFGVLLACLALGVATIAAVGSVSAVLQAGIDRDARTFLGGDLEARLDYRIASPDERKLFDSLGTTTAVTELSARATTPDAAAFLSLRAVDSLYPLLGKVETTPATPLPELLAKLDGVYGAVVDPLLLDRLGIQLGQTFTIGSQTFQARAALKALPDQAAQGFQLGVPVLISADALHNTGLLLPGILARYRYQLLLTPPNDYASASAAITKAFPGSGFELRSPRDAAEDMSKFFNLFGRFLVLVGLSSLLVGGVGVSNAVSAYITERSRSIATMRSLGATAGRINVHFLFQIMVLSSVGIAIGLALGALSTLAALPFLSTMLKIELPPQVHFPSLAIAAGFGLLIAFTFSFLPLLRAEKLRPASLFRSAGSGLAEGRIGRRDLIRWRVAVPLVIAIGAIVGLALLTTRSPVLVLSYAGGAVVAFIVLRLAAWLLQLGLRLLPQPPNAIIRNGLKAIYRPGAATATVVLSLGLGLSLLLLIATVDANLRAQLNGAIAQEAPSFAFINMARPDLDALQTLSQTDKRIQDFTATPILRGVVTRLAGKDPASIDPVPMEAQGMFKGDTPLTWSREIPKGSKVSEGTWWPADYKGDPQVSVNARLKQPLGLKLGDTMEMTILGRPLTATITNFRDLDQDAKTFSFNLVFSPGLIESAPASYTATLKAAPGEEAAVQSLLVKGFPTLPFIPIGDALARAAVLLASLANAIAVVGGLAIISGAFVLAGALSAGRAQRQSDAVVMKVLGATRRDVILAYLVEYGLLGVLSTILAAALGTTGAWLVVTRLLELPFSFEPALILTVMTGATALTIATGLITTWSALSVKPAQHLRMAE
ncbi:FtsX-like permease family protein [Devosia sp.]|uniref:ABC transporter permease n=1 Tax=Devosia sp. TaxID=1871048 RepID=UPI003264F2DA